MPLHDFKPKINTKQRWHPNLADIEFAWTRGSSGRPKASDSRATNLSNGMVRVCHLPSKICLEDEIQSGHYSRKEFMRIAEEKWQLLYNKLELQLAKHLKISGL